MLCRQTTYHVYIYVIMLIFFLLYLIAKEQLCYLHHLLYSSEWEGDHIQLDHVNTIKQLYYCLAKLYKLFMVCKNIYIYDNRKMPCTQLACTLWQQSCCQRKQYPNRVVFNKGIRENLASSRTLVVAQPTRSKSTASNWTSLLRGLSMGTLLVGPTGVYLYTADCFSSRSSRSKRSICIS